MSILFRVGVSARSFVEFFRDSANLFQYVELKIECRKISDRPQLRNINLKIKWLTCISMMRKQWNSVLQQLMPVHFVPIYLDYWFRRKLIEDLKFDFEICPRPFSILLASNYIDQSMRTLVLSPVCLIFQQFCLSFLQLTSFWTGFEVFHILDLPLSHLSKLSTDIWRIRNFANLQSPAQ